MGFPLIRPAIQPFFLRGVMLEELVGWPAIFWRSWGQHHQHHSFGLRGGKMTSRSTKNRANSPGWKFLLKRWEIQCEYVEIGCWFFSFLVPSIPVFKEPIFGTIPLKHLTEYLFKKAKWEMLRLWSWDSLWLLLLLLFPVLVLSGSHFFFEMQASSRTGNWKPKATRRELII